MIGAISAMSHMESGSIFGPGIGADAIGNLIVGDTSAALMSQRFVCEHTGYVESFRTWYKNSAGGYGAGTGGTIYTEIQTDDAGMPSGTQVGTGTVTRTGTAPVPIGTTSPDNRFDLQTLTTPVFLTAGTAYHFVYENIDADVEANFLSINCLYNQTISDPLQPKWGNDWYCCRKSTVTGNSWITAYSNTHYPILELTYVDGHITGNAYMNTAAGYAADSEIKSTTHLVRARFTMTENRIAHGAALRYGVQPGGTTGYMVCRLEDVNASYIDHYSDYGPYDEQVLNEVYSCGLWSGADFASPQLLERGKSYILRWSQSGGDRQFFTRTLQTGTVYGFSGGWSGDMQYTINSATNWNLHPNLTTSADLPFYLY